MVHVNVRQYIFGLYGRLDIIRLFEKNIKQQALQALLYCIENYLLYTYFENLKYPMQHCLYNSKIMFAKPKQ